MNNQKKNSHQRMHHSRFWLPVLLTILLFSSLSCKVPTLFSTLLDGIRQPKATQGDQAAMNEEPSPSLTPSVTPQPLPPAVVNVEPPLGSVLALDERVIFYFNQPMDKPSVEAAYERNSSFSAKMSWIDDATLAIEPQLPYTPASEISIGFDTTVQAANGFSLRSPVQFVYKAAGYLQVTNMLPEPDSLDIDPDSAVVANFNQPVVPLGADSADLPDALTIEPLVQGTGEWVNTSTYIFYPAVPLYGGKTYSVQINPDLVSMMGATLEHPVSWQFTTARPMLMHVLPEGDMKDIRLDVSFRLEFNQPMDAASVEDHFSLQQENNQRVLGEFGWQDNFRTMVFTPTANLERDMDYTLVLMEGAQSLGGTSLGRTTTVKYHTVPSLMVAYPDLKPGNETNVYAGVGLVFTAPLDSKQDFAEFVELDPPVSNVRCYYSGDIQMLRILGDFQAGTRYSLYLRPGLTDPWGGTMKEAYQLTFKTKHLQSALYIGGGNNAFFVTPDDTSFQGQATNLVKLNMGVGSVPFDDFVKFFQEDGYDFQKNYLPADYRYWVFPLDMTWDRNQEVDLPLTPDGDGLAPGIYLLTLSSKDLWYSPGPLTIVSSNVHLTYKISRANVLVWAVDLRTMEPVVNETVVVYDSNGEELARGETDSQGIFESDVDPYHFDNLFDVTYAMLSQPGDDLFSLSISNWDEGIASYDFGIPFDNRALHQKAYIYTDRPIYRAGQTVKFRAVVRNVYNGRYSLPADEPVEFAVFDSQYEKTETGKLTLSEFGTVNSEWQIPEDAQPGDYQLFIGDDSVGFKVAEYRKPEIDLKVNFASASMMVGSSLKGQVDAQYYFGAPAGNVPFEWTLLVEPESFYLPGYSTGKMDENWLYPGWMVYYEQFGYPLLSGEGKTGGDGTVDIDFSPDDLLTERCALPCRYTLEVTLTDESGFPVSARAETVIHPEDFYIGVRPDVYVGRVGNEIGFTIQVVDWDKKPFGEQPLHVEFQKVTWTAEETTDMFALPEYSKKTETVSRADIETDSIDGIARVAFVPPEPGTYQLDVSGGNAHTQALLWVGGEGTAIWPNLPNKQVRLMADKEMYQQGDTAEIFVPNPFDGVAYGLLTVERGKILRQRVIQIDDAGSTIHLAITEDDVPNVYVSLTMIGMKGENEPDFRQGYVTINVSPESRKLNVSLVGEPVRLEPGDDVSFKIKATDFDGNPVQAEFSLSVVDLAVLALADDNAPDIVTAFYGTQALGVRTSVLLSAYRGRVPFSPGGLGGGAGEIPPLVVRKNFMDTAYWNASIVTDEQGEASVTMTLPDNLTTWNVDVRGVTLDTRVGDAQVKVLTTKDLLVRPVTPRFLVVGDHLQIAAIVHNNSDEDLPVTVSLHAKGFVLDDPASDAQRITLPANGRLRVNWWGVVDHVKSVDLVFEAQGGGLSDASKPVWGDLPVISYVAPQTFGTSGVLSEEGELLEEFLLRYYGEGHTIPERLLLPVAVPEGEGMEAFLRERRGAPFRLSVSPRGEGGRLLLLARENARFVLHASLRAREEAVRTAGRLQTQLRLPRPPRAIECVDVSTTGGREAVGAVVRFEEGEPVKHRYRRYRIRTVAGMDDFAMIREVVRRRFRRGRREEELPDLFMVDGGKGQVAVAADEMARLGLGALPVVGLRKGVTRAKAVTLQGMEDDRVVLPGAGVTGVVPSGSPELYLLQRIRDEAHRFAVTYHRKRRSRAQQASPLDGISGLGAARRKALLTRFGGLRALRRAAPAEIEGVPGIGPTLAERIHRALHD